MQKGKLAWILIANELSKMVFKARNENNET